MNYDLFLEPEVHEARKSLPGNLRQRVRRIIDQLVHIPRSTDSEALDPSNIELSPLIELRRIRIERWRIIYAVCDTEQWVWLLAIRRRPPYDYEDLAELISNLPPVDTA